MTSATESKRLTETGPGTLMGELIRQYWLPALKSSELVADGDPVRLMLLGEKLIAFRDSSGRVGVMDHRCPHRCASLFFGRNEEDGIRCVYHGWKFDVDGNCLDMANVPPHQDFKKKVKAKAYKAAERAGVVWVYMGDAETLPGLPELEAINLPEEELTVTFVQRECNWPQAMEGDIDTSHFSFLHFGSVAPDDLAEAEMARTITTDRAPEYAFTETE
jgi:phthalate 4,5-dioxygenase oxygenase subunit